MTTDRRTFLRRSAAASLGAPALGILSGCAPSEGPPNDAPSLAELRAPEGTDDAAWAHVRARFMLPDDIAYMNNASLGMPPRDVVDAVANGYAAISSEPLHGKHDLQAVIAEESVPAIARIFGASTEEIFLTRNATEALHLQSVGLGLEAGDEVLITTQEHPAGAKPWAYRAAAHGITVREVFVPSPLDSAEAVVARFAEAIGPRTQAIAFCHVTRGGHRYPVRALCAMARERGLTTLVDGAQAVGQFPIDVTELGCDAYSASLHKWILGPTGTGFLYVNEDARPVFSSAFEPADGPTEDAYGPGGTADFPVRAALATATRFVEAIGLERVERRCRWLSDYLKEGLATLDGCTLLSGPDALSAPGSTIFELDGLDAVESVPLMEEIARVHIDEHQRDGHNAIRVSTHIYTTRDEIDRLLQGLREARG
ncbi:MAG: aminotransferase class V-fold PLP-dependent enzyme [Gemmatimonadota bacterium]